MPLLSSTVPIPNDFDGLLNNVDHAADKAANDPITVVGFGRGSEVRPAMFAFEHMFWVNDEFRTGYERVGG